ncbi:peptidylprolyl isomerase [Dermacoccaceae bacterium W4C1]
MLPRSRRPLWAAVSAAALVTLAGCSGDSSPGGTASSPASPSTSAAGACQDAPAAPGSASSYASAPATASVAGKTVVATVKTNCGDIVMELDGAKAPQTVASFEFLAKQGYWKDSPCHRLTAGGSLNVLQCGDPTGTGSGDPGYGYGIENAPADGQYPAGSVAMARTSDPDSNGGQFFIVYADSEIDPSTGGYSIFGKVTSGMDLLKKIAAKGVSGGGMDGAPAQPISILSVSVTEKKA